MKIFLKNYKTAIPEELQKLAEKNTVRECDETVRGHCVAYVDEGKDSFDVSLVFGTDQQISTHSCDCKNTGNFCRHKAALLIHIAKGTKTPQSVNAKKKSKAEVLPDEAGPEDLKQWVKDLLHKNKDI
jgi:hypothetical protein